MYNPKKYFAHIKPNEDGTWKIQTWYEHSDGVARLCAEFASKFGNQDWAEYIARFHDVGKLLHGWQNYLRDEVNYNIDRFPGKSDRGNHSTPGARLLYEKQLQLATRHVMLYSIMGHHAGLPDFTYGEVPGSSLLERLFTNNAENTDEIDKELTAQLNELLGYEDDSSSAPVKHLLDLPCPKSTPVFMTKGKISHKPMGLWIRMLYSCLVDADFLDTERFMDEEKFKERGGYSSLKELKQSFDDYMRNKSENSAPSAINGQRAAILAKCREKARLKPGIFTLSVPTGAGKTLASMAFALEHALEYGKDRIIVAIPYTSIIEQTASVYKYGTDDPARIRDGAMLFGEQNVVEHHSNFDTEKGGETETNFRNKLACENWDAPVIVTTNVQLFESLAGAKPSRCRKLHNIVNSVIVLDEAQLLPPEYLESITETMKHLVEYFNVTILLCTATQPALTGDIGTGKDGKPAFRGLENSVELADGDRGEMFSQFKRVDFHLPGSHKYESWQELSETLCQRESVLCVVNTRKSARDLAELMPEGTMHLSGFMCAEDRSDVIARVKEKLKNNEPVRLISTQLVEAGVDIDFPVVYRAYAGLDSMVQAAGRCNREGRMEAGGKVFIFNAPVGSPPGLLRKGEQAARLILGEADSFSISDKLCREYFELYYSNAGDLDKPSFKEHMVSSARRAELQFRTYAKNYRMIDDTHQRTIAIDYTSTRSGKTSKHLISQLRSGQIADRSLFRKLQRFTVTVPEGVFSNMCRKGYIEIIKDGGYGILREQEFYKLYIPGTGLVLDEPEWEGAMNI